MKIIFIYFFLITGLFANEIIFDLKQQDFVNSLSTKQLNTKYNLNDKLIVQTNLLKNEQGEYHTNAKTIGRLNVYPSIPVFDWSLNLDIQYEGLPNNNRFLKFTDTKGEVLLLEFHSSGFIFNSIDYNANLDKKHLLIQVMKKDNSVKFFLNKQLIDTQNMNFAKLKSIETTVFKFNVYAQDKLNNLLLVSHD